MESQVYTKPASTEPRYGGFWIRMVAYFVDGILNNIIGVLVGIILGIIAGMAVTSPEAALTEENMFILKIISFIISMFTTWLYFALFNSSKYMSTPGKMLFGLVVVDKQYQRISFAKATGRFFAVFVSMFIVFIGFIMAAFTNRKRALHDMIAGTYVIYK